MQPNPSGHHLSDRTITMDCLDSCKNLSHMYHMATEEAADPSLRRTLEHLLTSTLHMSDEVFRTSHRHGWYQVPNAEQGQVGHFLSQHRQVEGGHRVPPQSFAGHDPRWGERVSPDVGGFPHSAAPAFGGPIRAEGTSYAGDRPGERRDSPGWDQRSH